MDHDKFYAWLCELEAALLERIYRINPDISKRKANRYARLKVEQNCSNVLVSIIGHKRFAVNMKDGSIYGLSSCGTVKKNEPCGNLDTWDEWDWQPYYPIKKNLKEWEKEVCNRARPKYATPIFSVDENMSRKAWPYTSSTSRDTRSSTRDGDALGDERHIKNAAQDDQGKAQGTHKRIKK